MPLLICNSFFQLEKHPLETALCLLPLGFYRSMSVFFFSQTLTFSEKQSRGVQKPRQLIFAVLSLSSKAVISSKRSSERVEHHLPCTCSPWSFLSLPEMRLKNKFISILSLLLAYSIFKFHYVIISFFTSPHLLFSWSLMGEDCHHHDRAIVLQSHFKPLFFFFTDSCKQNKRG